MDSKFFIIEIERKQSLKKLLKGDFIMGYRIQYIGAHVEVFDNRGRFLFSADTAQEAEHELRELMEQEAA